MCKSTNGPFKITSYRELPEGDCLELKRTLLQKPVSVAITGTELQFYSEGVFDGCGVALNHAVLLIGYDETIGWKIKNSWGVNWGVLGFGWISEENNCRICEIAIVPTIAEEPGSAEANAQNSNSNQQNSSTSFLTQ